MADQWKPGESLSASKLNRNSASTNSFISTGSAGFAKHGSIIGYTQPDLNPEVMWVAITESHEEPINANYADSRSVFTHSWNQVTLCPLLGAWRKNEGVGGHYNIDPVLSPEPSTALTVSQEVTIKDWTETFYDSAYAVFRDNHTGSLFALNSSGSINIKAQDLTVLLLGTYDEYKDCPALANLTMPPNNNGTLCQPAYAWAAYKVCGYNYIKQFDIRTLPKWALELNGGTGGINAHHIPRWGWDSYTNGPPNLSANSTCAGVKFLGAGTASLSCPDCPDWLSAVTCFKITVEYLTEAEVPCEPGSVGCQCDSAEWECFTDKMSSLWGETIDYILCSGGGCSWDGGDNSPFTFSMFSGNIPGVDDYDNCFFGPSTIEPCYPCDGFKRVYLGVNAGSSCGGNPGQVYSAYYLSHGELRGLIEDCTKGPLGMNFQGHVNQDGSSAACPNVIKSIKISCCSENQINDCVNPEGV